MFAAKNEKKKLPAVHFALLFNFAAQRLANFFLGEARRGDSLHGKFSSCFSATETAAATTNKIRVGERERDGEH